jgi:regulator of nucleoside diphosphate kinase
MNTLNFGERTLTELDFGRLSQVAGAQQSSELSDLLVEADVVTGSLVPRDVVSMYAQVELEDVATSRRHKFVVCYPGQTEPRDGYISVLSPIGLALIGLRVGSVARWKSPSGQECKARVMMVSRIAHFSVET